MSMTAALTRFVLRSFAPMTAVLTDRVRKAIRYAFLAPDIVRAMVLPLLSVGEMTLRLYTALNYSHNSAYDLRRALNGA